MEDTKEEISSKVPPHYFDFQMEDHVATLINAAGSPTSIEEEGDDRGDLRGHGAS